MLTLAENELLTRVGSGPPLGTLLRCFWQPFALASELPTSDCAPIRVRLRCGAPVAFRARAGKLPLDVKLVVSNSPAARALERARAAGDATSVLEWRRSSETRAEYATRLAGAVRASGARLVLLLGWMHVLSREFLDAGFDVQTANDLPRWGHTSGRELQLEDRFDEATYAGLERRGHVVRRVAPWENTMGRACVIAIDENGVRQGSADLRSEGSAAGW